MTFAFKSGATRNGCGFQLKASVGGMGARRTREPME